MANNIKTTEQKNNSNLNLTALGLNLGAAGINFASSFASPYNESQDVTMTSGLLDNIGTLTSSFGPWGAVAGAGIKTLGAGISALDAFGAKKANTFNMTPDINKYSGFSGETAKQNLASTVSNQKYGLFNKKGLSKANKLVNSAKGNQEEISSLLQKTALENKVIENSYSDQRSKFLQNMYAGNSSPVLIGKSGIHIKKANKGKFTEYCNGKVTDECIAKGKRSSNPVIRKRAVFAANSRTWKHKNGGKILNGVIPVRLYQKGGWVERDVENNDRWLLSKKNIDDGKSMYAGNTVFDKGKDIETYRRQIDKKYGISYIKEKSIKLTNAGKDTGAVLSTNMLDSVAKYASRVKLPLYQAIGLAAQESTLVADKKRSMYMEKGQSGKQPYIKDPINTNVPLNTITPTQLVSNINYYRSNPYYELVNTAYAKDTLGAKSSKWFEFARPDDDYDTNDMYNNILKGLNYANNKMKSFNINEHPLEHAFNLYKTGNYNRGEKDHSDKVNERGKAVLNSPEVQKWLKTSPYAKNMQIYKLGGKISSTPNVIAEGSLHARKNNLQDVDAHIANAVTSKGVPVISFDNGGEITQHAEIERDELILNKEVTDKLEQYRKENTEESAIAAGKLLTLELSKNTINNNVVKYQQGGVINNKYVVKSGDSLWKISQNLTGNGNNYKELATYNNIQNPDKIYIGQTIELPSTFIKSSPTKDTTPVKKTAIFDDYDKSQNPNSNFPKVIRLSSPSTNKPSVKTDSEDSDVKVTKKTEPLTQSKSNVNITNPDVAYRNQPLPINERLSLNKGYKLNPLTQSNSNVGSSDPIYQPLLDFIEKVKNYQIRQLSKKFGEKEAESNMPKYKESLLNTKYGLIPLSFTGDTIKHQSDPSQYIVPESINTTEYSFGGRNRGIYDEINSEAAPITLFHPLKPFGQHNTNYKTFIGYDKNGMLKVGDISTFSEGDMLSGTFSNVIEGFKKDANGNFALTLSTHNKPLMQPIPILYNSDDKNKQGNSRAINILVNKDAPNTYQRITGGRMLVKAGNETRLISGSLENLDAQIEDMKKRQGVDNVTVYTLDNGSYNLGLRTRSGKFTKKDLQSYDNQNSGGGHFLYLKSKDKPLKFINDTVLTPNIRTEFDESFKKGHSLTNDVKGAVLHYTAFNDEDLTGVTNYLTKPGGNSAHVIIGYDGNRKILAKPENVTFHAGESIHEGRTNVNDFMVGLEFQGNTNIKPLTDSQIESAIEYLEPIIRKYNIRLEDLVTHKQIRDAYNDYAEKNKMKKALSKQDIGEKDYERIIDRLLQTVYYKK